MSRESEIRSHEKGRLDALQGKNSSPPHSSIAEMLFDWSNLKGQQADQKAYKEGYKKSQVIKKERES